MAVEAPKAVLELVERGALRRQIAATDDEIDHLVYELYEFTPEGIALVEESGRK